MRMIRCLIVATALLLGSFASAKNSGVGLSVGMGLPFLQQVGLNYKISDRFGLSFGYNLLDLSSGAASVKLSMPELLVHYHPFSGAFFVAAGLGQEALEVTAKDLTTGATAKADVKSMAAIAKTGWMWGLANNGFWFGVDLAFVSPSNPDVNITAPGVPTNSTAYTDTVDAAKKFGETSFTNITFARIGWVF
ncbi:MAG: hypothetical protein KF767_19140 [Bdellovibrionaceae bacterium]|nr:hypothetical protein [Pseudobdellovibrionaceae bacterium]